MIKELLFGKRVRSILIKTDKILKKIVQAPKEDLKDVYKTTADMIVGIAGKIFTPENIEAGLKAYLAYQAQKSSGEDGVGVSFSKKF